MGPQDGLVNWVHFFLRLGVEAGSKEARKMGWLTGFNVSNARGGCRLQ